MYKVSLINMPFADLWYPSIALTQLKTVVEEQLGDKVSVRILYLNQDIAQYFGVRLYCYISGALETNMAAMGDWLFSNIAFPDKEDNVDAYFQRCFPGTDPETENNKVQILRKRKGLSTLLDRLISKYALADDDLVGFTSMFCQNGASFALAKRIKDRNSRVITIVGGANCESPMGQELARHADQIDYVFSGPALKSLPQFLQACVDADRGKCDEIRGVFSRRNADREIGLHESLGEELDINHDVRLDYSLFLDTLEKNFQHNDIRPILLFETSRGCWWGQKAHCTFCGLNGGTMAYRSMEPAAAIRKFNEMFEYASRCTHFNAVDNILPKSYLAEVLPHIHTPETAELFYEVKADLSKKDVEVLSKARVKRIQPGIESLSTSTLKLMRKGTTVFQNLALLRNCLVFGIHVEWNLLIGFPGEPEKVFEKYVADIPRLVHLPPPQGTFHVRFDRYSPYFVQAKEYGLDLHPSDFYRFIYPFSEEVLRNIAYYFTDHNYSAAYISAVSAWSTRVRDQIAFWRSRWDGGRYSAPKLVWKTRRGTTVVYDSRGESEIEHELDESGTALLQHLAIPKRESDLVSLFPAFDAAKELANLKQKGLVFEEEQRYMSLVTEDPVDGQNQAAEGSLNYETSVQEMLPA